MHQFNYKKWQTYKHPEEEFWREILATLNTVVVPAMFLKQLQYTTVQNMYNSMLQFRQLPIV